MKKYYKFFSLILVLSVVFSSSVFAAENVFTIIRDKGFSFLSDLKNLIYVLAGFGIIVFAWAAIFGKISWKHFSNIAIGLFLVSSMGMFIAYFTHSTGGGKVFSPEYGSYLTKGFNDTAGSGGTLPPQKPGDDPTNPDDSNKTDEEKKAEQDAIDKEMEDLFGGADQEKAQELAYQKTAYENCIRKESPAVCGSKYPEGKRESEIASAEAEKKAEEDALLRELSAPIMQEANARAAACRKVANESYQSSASACDKYKDNRASYQSCQSSRSSQKSKADAACAAIVADAQKKVDDIDVESEVRNKKLEEIQAKKDLEDAKKLAEDLTKDKDKGTDKDEDLSKDISDDSDIACSDKKVKSSDYDCSSQAVLSSLPSYSDQVVGKTVVSDGKAAVTASWAEKEEALASARKAEDVEYSRVMADISARRGDAAALARKKVELEAAVKKRKDEDKFNKEAKAKELADVEQPFKNVMESYEKEKKDKCKELEKSKKEAQKIYDDCVKAYKKSVKDSEKAYDKSIKDAEKNAKKNK